jgi:hypothetical protein
MAGKVLFYAPVGAPLGEGGVGVVSYGPARSVEAHDIDAGRHLTMWFFGMVGILTATTGLWLSLAPENGEISLIFVTLDMSEVSPLLGPTLLLVGGIVLAIAMLSAAGRDYHFQAAWWMVWLQAVLGLVGVAAAILGALALLDRADIYTLPGLPF